MVYVLVVPAAFVMIASVFQAMEYYAARQGAETAARQAVDAARLVGAGSGAGVTRADSVLGQLGSPLEAANVTVTAQGAMVVVTVTGRAHRLIPALRLQIQASARAPREQFQAPP